jgi:hypothetical protein
MFDPILDGLGIGRFARRVRAACRANGWTPHALDAAGAVLRLTDAGDSYTVLLTRVSESVGVSAGSRAEFLPKRFPPGLRKVLAERTAEGRAVGWSVVEGEAKCFALARLILPLAEFDAGSLGRAVAAVLAEVGELNAGLKRRGLI